MNHYCGRIMAGDRGQQYEVTFFNPQTKSRQVFGWSDNLKVADNMRSSITKHPTWRDPKVRDRNCLHERVYYSTGICKSCGVIVK